MIKHDHENEFHEAILDGLAGCVAYMPEAQGVCYILLWNKGDLVRAGRVGGVTAATQGKPRMLQILQTTSGKFKAARSAAVT
jgi:hypothetical protein